MFIDKQKEIKQDKYPTFFSDNADLSLGIENNLNAVKKAIEWLEGNDNLMFNEEEKSLLNKGSIGNIMKKYKVNLPTEENATLSVEA